MKAHCPGLKGAPGLWIHLHMFNKCHIHWRETFETEIMDKNLHRNQWEKVYKLTESLKNVIHILGNAYQSVWPRIYSLLSPIVTLFWLFWSWSDQRPTERLNKTTYCWMVYKRRILSEANDLQMTKGNLETNLEMNVRSPLDTFPLKNKSFSTKLFS